MIHRKSLEPATRLPFSPDEPERVPTGTEIVLSEKSYSVLWRLVFRKILIIREKHRK
jgi:hypothetical protein